MTERPKPSPPEGPLPEHVAIIMDGNGRWAKDRDKPRIFGHNEGAKTVRDIVTYSREIGIRYLTLFAFSSENWGRPDSEVAGLMDLLSRHLVKERPTMLDNGIELSAIGDTDRLPPRVQDLLEDLKQDTEGLTGMRLTLALSYGGRDDVVRAVRDIAKDIAAGRLTPEGIDEALIASRLDTGDMPDPDLLIRTSGESRVSNFMLWQLAYTEIVFTETPWPAFNRLDFNEALRSYQRRERRFGRTGAQVADGSTPDGAAL